jgi:hypothetical protein
MNWESVETVRQDDNSGFERYRERNGNISVKHLEIP